LTLKCTASSPAIIEEAARVLFGMVVRERRRIAALGHTASLLDKRVQEAEAALMSKEEAFHSYINEQGLEVVSLLQNQQEHILSLMELVKEEPEEFVFEIQKSSNSSKQRPSSRNSKLLLLAYERISVLENQLKKVHAECEDLGYYGRKEELARAKLKDETNKNKQLTEIVKHLRSTLKSVQDDVGEEGEVKMAPERKDVKQQKIVNEISNALQLQQMDQDSPNVSKAYLPANSNRAFDLEYNSDEEDGVPPDWVEEIINDLSSSVQQKESDLLNFQRLSDPMVGLCNRESKQSILVDPPFVEHVPTRSTQGLLGDLFLLQEHPKFLP